MALDEAELRARAERETGLSDWGGDEFRQPLAELVAALNNDAQLTTLGERRAADYLVHRLSQRLRLFADRKALPQIAQQRIEKPIFLTGFPRAGTSFLQNLLAADPDSVSPQFWQLLHPSPPPNARGIDHSAQIEQTRAFFAHQSWLDSGMLTVHDFDVDSNEECFFLFELSFVSTGWTGFFYIPSYGHTLARGFEPAYAMHYKGLQAMQIGAEGRRWVLKAPEHCMHLNALFATYPDATIVQHHRDPAKVIASMLSVLKVLRRPYSDLSVIGAAEARGFIEMYAASMAHMISLRQAPGMTGRVIDVHYLDLERDPMAVVERIYAEAHIEFSAAARAAVAKLIVERRKHRHGVHRYLLSEYGLTAEEVRDVFRLYIDHFGVTLEPGA